ncbi:MAG TPA: hypothetical protein VJ508_15485, partial [Saprospiraceae bacterium]|nr:hypothetical protein [Saprospiraceae bacterium]
AHVSVRLEDTSTFDIHFCLTFVRYISGARHDPQSNRFETEADFFEKGKSSFFNSRPLQR